jgi:hypothetical protein
MFKSDIFRDSVDAHSGALSRNLPQASRKLKGERLMFGIEDFWIWSAYLLCLLAAILCVVYGALTWNKDGDDTPTAEDREWEKEEEVVDEAL